MYVVLLVEKSFILGAVSCSEMETMSGLDLSRCSVFRLTVACIGIYYLSQVLFRMSFQRRSYLNPEMEFSSMT